MGVSLSPTDVEHHRDRLLAGGVIEEVQTGRPRSRYRLTDSARTRVGVFAKLARIEKPEFFSEDVLCAADAESAIIIALPAVRLSKEASGVCALRVRPDPYMPPPSRELFVSLRNGRVVDVSDSPSQDAVATVDGKAAHWLAAVMDGHSDLLSVSGNGLLAQSLVEDLHRRTYIAPRNVRRLGKARPRQRRRY